MLAGKQQQLKCHHVVKGGSKADVKETDGKKNIM